MDKEFLGFFDIINELELTFFPPGGTSVLDFWINETNINQSSIILDICCSTGFFSRYISKKTDCFGYGIDIDKNAIIAATNLAKKEKVKNLEYLKQDAHHIYFDNNIKFSHMLVGNGFAFIKDKKLALNNMMNYLEEGGCFLVNTFYYNQPLPNPKMLNVMNNICGLYVKEDYDYNFWTLLFQNHLTLEVEADIVGIDTYELCEEDLLVSIKNMLNQSSKFNKLDINKQNHIENSLLYARKILNNNQKYLDSKVQIWKK